MNESSVSILITERAWQGRGIPRRGLALADAEAAGWTVMPTVTGHRGMPTNRNEDMRGSCHPLSITLQDMSFYRFTLIVECPDIQSDRAIDALFDAGCDDALVGRADGIQYVDFDREGPNPETAILSAIADVERLPDVEVIRIAGCGLVSMADIATRTGRSRESTRLLVTNERGPGRFPAPVTDPRARYRLWRWSEVRR